MRATKAIKADAGGGLDILAVPFGSPLPGGRDLDGERFAEDVDLAWGLFGDKLPMLFHHGRDDEGPALEAIGHIDVGSARKAPDGWWVRGWLNQRHKYLAFIKELLEASGLGASSAAIGHLVRRTKDGIITRWPLIEVSLTATPSNPGAVVTAAQAKAHFAASGLALPAALAGTGGGLDLAQTLQLKAIKLEVETARRRALEREQDRHLGELARIVTGGR